MDLPIISAEDVAAVKALTYDDRENLANRINATDPHEIFTTAGRSSNDDKRKIICPNCGNGSGNDKTPVVATFKDGVWLYHCFKGDDLEGNLLKIIAHEQHLNLNDGNDFAQALAIGAALVGYSVPCGNYTTRRPRNKIPPPAKIQAVEEKIPPLPPPAPEYERLAEARANLPAFIDAQPDKKFRGLPLETLLRLNWGFLPDFNHPSPNDKRIFPALIVPNDRNGIFARRTDADQKSNIAPSAPTTIVTPTADKNLVVVEGAIDGASIAYATDFGVGVIATGGTSGANLLLARLQELFLDDAPKPKVILLLDHDAANFDDDPGQKAAAKLLPKIRDLGFVVVNRVISDEPRRDPNKILVDEGRENLRERMEKIIAAAAPEFAALEDEMATDEVIAACCVTPAAFDAATQGEIDIANADFNRAVESWERINGKVTPDVKAEVKRAADLLNSLTAQKFSALKAQSSEVKNAVALCTFYDFAADAAENFWATLKAAKANAAAQVDDAKANQFRPPADVQALADLHLSDLQKDVREFVTSKKRERKNFLAGEEKRQALERRKNLAVKRDAQKRGLIEELKALATEPQSDDRDARIIEALHELCEWRQNAHGEPVAIKSTAQNAEWIFDYDPALSGVIGFDEFQQAEVFLKPPPWKKVSCIGQEWKDEDNAQTRFYLRTTYAEFGEKQTVADALTVFSRKRSFHPVKKFLEELPKWDGVPRAETVFVKFLGADDTPYVREVTLNWLIAAVARIYFPGCPYQTAIILHGNQGIGKSYVLEALGGSWYAVISDDVDRSNIFDAIRNIWIGEFREMKGMRKADVNAIKSFIDTAVDNRRLPYGRDPERIPRHTVFAISVNDDQFLSDVTGNRRFPVIECRNLRGQYVEGLTAEFVAQVWAEVTVKFKELLTDENGNWIRDLKAIGKKLELSREAKQQVEGIAEKHMRDDGLTTEIKGYLGIKIPPQVIWLALTRDERREFVTKLKVYVRRSELVRRIKNRAWNKSSIDRDANECDEMLSVPENLETLYMHADPKNDDGTPSDELIIFGTELRKHICAAEIRAECFAPNDRRAVMPRINELLTTLEGWELGERLRNADPVYPDQKRPYFRAATDDEDDTAAPEFDDDFIGPPSVLENPPF